MRFPHVQGGFRQSLTVDEKQAIPIAPAMTMAEAAMAEPLAVCLHAARRAGSLMGAKVLVTGCGPIGALAVVAARFGGAAEIVATDVSAFPLSLVETVGATRAINIAEDPQALAPYAQDKGSFDVLFEASGNEAALRGALDAVRPGGIVVQLGLGGDMKLPDQPDRGQGAPVARDVPLRRGVPACRRSDGKRADRREAAGQPDDPVRARGGSLRAGLRPVPRDEGATRVLTGD